MRNRTLRTVSLAVSASLAVIAFSGAVASSASAETSVWLGQAGGGQTHECMVRSDGRVKCWGYANPGGYFGGPLGGLPGSYTAATYPFTMTIVSGITTARKVSVGYYNTCILLADTTVKCMGDNAYGQLGDGTNVNRNDTPTTVSGLTGVKDIVLGGQVGGNNAHACALMLDGTVKCWGGNNYGQLGDGTTTNRWVPVSVTGITNAVSIVSGFSTVCAVLSTGSVKCWGYGGLGALGNGNGAYTATNLSTVPVNVSGVANAVDLSTESLGYGMCARTSAGEVYCWGGARVPGYSAPGPAKIAGISGAKQFIPGGCWITSTDTVKCFAPSVPYGAPDQPNIYGELGNGTNCAIGPGVTCPGTNTPGVDVTGLTGVAQLSLMDRLFCARLSSGSIHCWGDNIYGIAANKLTNAGNVSACGWMGALNCRITNIPYRVMELSVGPAITSAPAALTNETSGTVSFTSEPTATTECKIDLGTWAPCTSPFSYSGLAGGAHKIYVRSTDPGGVPSPEVSASFSLDLTPPPAPSITAGPAASSKTNVTAGNLTFTGETGATFQCQLDSGAWATCTSPFAYSGLTDGSHTFSVRAIDAVGNVGAATTRTWTTDTVVDPPVITSKPNASTNRASAYFFYTGEVGASFECAVDGGAYAACGVFLSTYVADGSHTFSVRQKDAAGNVSAPASWAWTVDTTAPADPVITSAPPSRTGDTTATFSFTGEPGATYECALDGYYIGWRLYPNYRPCTSPITYTGVSAGSHTFNVRQIDAAGNYSMSSATKTWTVGSISPSSITAAPSGVVSTTTASVAFTIAPDTAAVCSIDGGAYAPCTSPLNLTGLADGPHSVSVKLSNAFGYSTPVTASWTVDSTAPSVPTITTPPANPSGSSASIGFSGEAGATFKCQLDGGDWIACSSPFSATDLTDGAHTLKIKSIDSAGNESPETTVDWTVDTVAPDAPVLTANPDAVSNDATPTFAFNLEANASAECKLDDGAWVACTSPVDYTGVIDGDHTFSVRQIDEAGNVSSATDYSWTLDTAAPDAPTITAPSAGASTSADQLTFTQVAGLTYKCQIDGGDIVDCTSPLDLSALADGDHAVKIWAYDDAGNQSEPSELSFTRDTTAPSAPSIGGVPGNGTTDYTASLTLDGAGTGETFECQVNGGAWAACTSPLELSGLTDGPQSVKVRIVDAAGNVSAETEAKWSIGVYVTDPVVTAPDAGSITAADTVEFTVQADTTTTCSLDGSPPFDCSSPYDTSGMPEGFHTLDITSTDADGHYATKHFEWTIDRSAPDAPAIDNIPASGTTDPTASLDLSGADSTDTYECSVNGGDFTACVSPLTLTGLADGLYTVQARIKDSAGNVGEPSTARWLVGEKMVMPPAGVTGTATLSGPREYKLGPTLAQTFALSTFNVTTIWPAGATDVILSNSPTFANSKRFPVYRTAAWGNPVAKPGTFGTRTVYFKYRGAGGVLPDVYMTSYRWDRATPFIKMAARKHLLGYKPDAWKVRLVGNDRGPAGLDKVQFWMSNKDMPKSAPIQGAWHSGYVTNWRPVVTVPGGHQPIWVRASDKAGNWGRWYLIK